jgi:putative addiction module component (TIGR02574 family)
MTDKDAVLEQALALTVSDRAELVESLIVSFSFEEQADINAAILVEVEDRLRAYDSGEMDAVDWEDWKQRTP